MAKSAIQLQDELNREIDYTRKLNEKIERIREQLKNSISKDEHEKKINELKMEYERRLSEINSRPPKIHNERGAGRKKIASQEAVDMVLELSRQGLSQSKITTHLLNEMDFKIGRTTVGEIVRGNYKLPNKT